MSKPKQLQTRAVPVAGILSTALFLLWLAVFPLACDFTYQHITAAKWACCLLGTGLTVLLAVPLILLRPKGHRVTLSPALFVALGYFAWVALSAAFGRLHTTVSSQNAATFNSHSWSQGVSNLLAWVYHLVFRPSQPVVWIGGGRYEGLSTQLCYLLIFLVMSQARLPKRAALTGVAAAMLVFCLIIGLQYAGLNPLELYPTGRSIFTNYEFQGTIGNIDMIAAYTAVALPLLIGWWVLEGGIWGGLGLAAGLAGALMSVLTDVQCALIALLAGMALLVCLAVVRKPASVPDEAISSRSLIALGGLVLCLFSRSLLHLPWLDGTAYAATVAFTWPANPVYWALLVIGAGLIALGILQPKALSRLRLRPRHLILVLVALALVMVLLVAVLPIPERMGGLWEAHELLNGRPQDTFGSWRLGVWRHTLHLSAEAPLFGTGPDVFTSAIMNHLAEENAYLGENYDNPHSVLLMIVASNGYPALALFLAMVVLCVVRALRGGIARWPLAASILCWLAQGLFTFSIAITSPMAWVVFGLAAGGAPEEEFPPVRAKK